MVDNFSLYLNVKHEAAMMSIYNEDGSPPVKALNYYIKSITLKDVFNKNFYEVVNLEWNEIVTKDTILGEMADQNKTHSFTEVVNNRFISEVNQESNGIFF